jgi:hypothetical protein
MDTSPFITFGLVTLTALSPASLNPALIRHSADNNHHARHSGHPPHAPATRIVSATVVGSTSGHHIIALPDVLEHTHDAATERIKENLKRYVQPLSYRA